MGLGGQLAKLWGSKQTEISPMQHLTHNIHIRSLTPLVAPQTLRDELPVSEAAQ